VYAFAYMLITFGEPTLSIASEVRFVGQCSHHVGGSMLLPLAAVLSLPIDLTLRLISIQWPHNAENFYFTRCLYQTATEFSLSDEEVDMNIRLSRLTVASLYLIEGLCQPIIVPLVSWHLAGLCLQWIGIGLCFLSTYVNQLPPAPPVIADAMAYLPSFRFFAPERSVTRLDDERFSPNARM